MIAHRGASGDRPEHTLAAYSSRSSRAPTSSSPTSSRPRTASLVARHENEICGTTDVADHPEFAARRTTKTIDGVAVTGWFTEDFTLAELKTLRAKERLPQLRAGNTAFDGRFEVPTLQEVIDLAESAHAASASTRRRSTRPTSTRSASRSRSRCVAGAAARTAATGSGAPVFIQSFEVGEPEAAGAG